MKLKTNSGLGQRLMAGFAGLAGSAFVAHAAPSITAIGPIRRRLFPKLSGISRSNSLALTFDDGPDINSTPLFLEELDRLGWKATFFMLGTMAERQPELVREITSRGHEIALHGYAHKNLLLRTPQATDSDIRRGFNIISELAGSAPRFYRPPYGVLNLQAVLTARSIGLTPILWTSWGRDWRSKATPSTVISDLSHSMAPGTTLLLHDSDCTSAPQAYLSALGALHLLSEKVEEMGTTVERLCDHFPA